MIFLKALCIHWGNLRQIVVYIGIVNRVVLMNARRPLQFRSLPFQTGSLIATLSKEVAALILITSLAREREGSKVFQREIRKLTWKQGCCPHHI
jgi:hypothetical protein